MSVFSTLLNDLKSRATQIEQAIAQSIANHNVLLGQGAELKNMLDMATKAAEVVLPGNPVTEVLATADEVVDEIASLVPAASSTEETPAS